MGIQEIIIQFYFIKAVINFQSAKYMRRDIVKMCR